MEKNIFNTMVLKESSDEEKDNEENIWASSTIPLPIQTFLWRQTSPFIRPKISRLQDASAMEQREACKLFEKVLVQNIQFGLSPSLTEAIHSVSRWRMIMAALPHVMHCCSTLLYARRKSSFDKLSASETKLLYTLHWIMLDAAEECADEESEKGIHRSPEHYLLPITTIQTFIYLFAPLIPHLKQSDFLTSFRLENGYKIWTPLFHYCHPEIPSFLAHAKRKNFIMSRIEKKITIPKFGDVFIGSNEKKALATSNDDAFDQKNSFVDFFPSPTHDITSNKEDFKKKYEFSEKDLVEPSIATYLDVAVLRCLFSNQWIEEGILWSLNYIHHRLECIRKSKDNKREFCRSHSLPTPKRNYKDIDNRKPFASKSLKFSSSVKTKENNLCNDNQNNTATNSHLKTSTTFQEFRRSSFSGLPGLSGFQALISSTSSASFGRHGSEKVKHKKHKKHNSERKTDSPIITVLQQQSKTVIDSKHDSHKNSSYQINSKLEKEQNEKERMRFRKIYEKVELNKNRSKLQTDNSFKNQEKTAKFNGWSCLIDKNDFKGKSMPSLHLIDQKEFSLSQPFSINILNNEKLPKCSSFCLIPKADRTSSRTSLVEQDSIANVSFPIITITEHSPIASRNFFDKENNKNGKHDNDFVSYYKLYFKNSAQENLFLETISRWKSDTNINYTIETSGESLASINYVTKNGHLSLIIILKAVHSITLKDSVCSIQVCQMIYKIVVKLLSFKLISKQVGYIYKAKKYKTFKPNSENVELPLPHLFLDTLFRIIKQLGCSRGCSEGRREPEAARLKENVLRTLKLLQEISETHFVQYCEILINSNSIQDIIDIFHAFFGFCSEQSTTTILNSNVNTHLTTFLALKKCDPIKSKNGYFNNFGTGFSNKIAIDSIIVNSTFKNFVTRLVYIQKELKVQENMSLYCEIRQFISFVRDHHGGIFRNVALSGLIDSTKFMLYSRKIQENSRENMLLKNLNRVSNSLIPNEKDINKNNSFLKQKLDSNQTNFGLDQEEISVSTVPLSQSNMPTCIQNSFLVPYEEYFIKNLKTSKTGFNITNLFKQNQQNKDSNEPEPEPQQIEENLQNYLVITEALSERMIRRGSLSRQTIKNYSAQSTVPLDISQKPSFFKARKRMDQFKNVFGKNKMKQSSLEETPEISRKNSLDLSNRFSDVIHEIPLKKSKTILLEILKNGMLNFEFLLDTCTPGTIPDAQLIAAMLDLKAPVLARAAFLLECCNFVHQCNKGHWPSWIKLNFSFFRPSGSRSGSQSVVKTRASTTLQKMAGRGFYQWGELLASRLEDLLKNDIENMKCGSYEGFKQQFAQEDVENFLNISSLNSKEENCPFALKIIACQLLFEVTSYLRETHQYLLSKSSRSSSITTKDQRIPCEQLKLPIPQAQPTAVNTNRRWSMAFANVSGSNSGAHIFDHGSNLSNDRRISFVLHEAETENDSNSLNSNEDNFQEKKRSSQAGTTNLLWRNSGTGHHDSFRRKSIKLKRNENNTKLRSATLAEDDYRFMFKRSNSLRSKRKMSCASETSERFSGEESPGINSENSFESAIDNQDTNDIEIIENIPWIKISDLFSQAMNFECQHNPCSKNCHKIIIKSSMCLTKAVQRLYERDIQPGYDFRFQKFLDDKEDVAKKEKKLKKILMGHSSSPIKRKASTHNFEKLLDRESHGPSVYNSSTGISHINLDLESGFHESEDPRCIFNDVLNYRIESKIEENVTMLYILNQVKNPFHSIVSMMLKSALILNKNQFEYMLKIGWNLILEDDIQISSSASVAIIVCSLKCPDIVIDLLKKELNHSNVDVRVNAVNKFLKIWCNRYQCWQRLEEGSHLVLKLPPAAIEFTLPSPRLALENKPVVDPPYTPIVKSKVDDVTINQEPSIQKTFVSATKTRKKQQIEMVTYALQEREKKLKEERENYRLNSVPLNFQAAYEPALYHTIEDHDDNEDDVERIPLHHLQVAQSFFPSSLTTGSMLLINLLEDTQVNSEGFAVSEIAYKVVWQCLIEDSALFFRNLVEKLTRDKKNTVIQTFRRLIRFVPRLPSQAAFNLYNYLIGFIMHHVRTPTEDSQEIIASTMSIIWLIVPNVYGLFLKDLKQILRKEQCDASILITANVPSAKKIIIHGPDASLIPSQLPVHENTQFSQILTDSLDFFSIEESKHNEYFLVDTKTNQIHNLNAFVRDFYFFKRSQYPQLTLVHMNPKDAYDKFQKQAFTIQFTELGKCLMSLALIKTSFLGIQRVLFLHEELMKLPSFPRKALETNLTLYTGPMGREVLGIDTLHKVAWIKLVARMFEATSGFFADASEIHLFLNVINGTLLLHCEDASILRLCMSTYINVAHQFKNIFATNGYLLIVQTIVQIYGTHQTNSLLCRTVEFVFKQFYILHRKPFVLQMFGAVAPLLDAESLNKSTYQIHPGDFFQLLQSLGQYTADPLDILELIDAEKPLKALDFCYQMDSDTLTILDAISLCVTVVSYASDSERSHQMLTILDAILPYHLMQMRSLTTRKETPGGPRAELQMIHNISVCMKTLVYNCEALTRNFTGPQKSLEIRDASIKNVSPQFEIDEDSHSKYNPDNYYSQRYNQNLDNVELNRLEFRKPRDLLLKIVSEFLTRSAGRFADLSKKIADGKISSFELLDVKSHIRLAEIAHSLFKLAPYDPQTMACKGLVRYMNEILPNSEWRQERMRPALIMVLRRLDKTFTKISKKAAIKRSTDWEAARRLLKGVYLTFIKHPYIVHLPHLKSLINVCQNIILGDQLDMPSSSAWTAALSQAPPSGFTSVAVRLISLQMIQLGDSQSLETICGGASFSSPEKSEIYLMNMIYPLCIRISSGIKDVPKLRHFDINFVLNVILNILKPINTKSLKGSDSSQAGLQLKQFSLQQIGFLGLKILISCFEKQLNAEWYRISKCIRDLAEKPHLIGSTFWNFIDFICTYRTPLFVLLLPYIKCKYMFKPSDNEIERTFKANIQEKLNGNNLPMNRSKGNLFVSLVNELKMLREEIIRRKNNPMTIDERSKSIAQEPNSTGTSEKQESSGHRLSFAFSQLAASASKISNISSSNSNTAPVSTIAHSNVNAADQSSVPSAPENSSVKPKILRGLSFRLSSDSRRLASRGLSVKLASNQSDKKMFTRRTSYPDQQDLFDNDSLKHNTHSEPKLFRRLTVHIKNSTKSKYPLSYSGEELNENVNTHLMTGKEDFIQAKHRIQKQKAQNRKSYRLKKSQQVDQPFSKSESIENVKELNEYFNDTLRKKDSLEISSSTHNSSNQTLTSSQEKYEQLCCKMNVNTNNDANGNSNIDSLISNCDKTFEKKILKSFESNFNNNNGNKSTSNLNTSDYSKQQIIKNLSLSSLTQRNLSSDSNSITTNLMSPFESSLTTLPFVDED